MVLEIVGRLSSVRKLRCKVLVAKGLMAMVSKSNVLETGLEELSASYASGKYVKCFRTEYIEDVNSSLSIRNSSRGHN